MDRGDSSNLLLLSVGLPCLLYSNSDMCVLAVVLFPEQALECLTSCKSCSEIEGSGLSLAA